MKNICFYFQIHQPQRLRQYRFFNIGIDHYYYDDFANDEVIQQIASISYVPANNLLLEMIEKSGGKFRAAFSVSGVALNQLEFYAPEVIDGLKQLVDTGCVEILSETQANSLSSLIDPEEFKNQVESHTQRIKELFGVTPKVFKNTELIYSDEIAPLIRSLGFEGVVVEGARHALAWRSPNYVYESISSPGLKLLPRNEKLSNDIGAKFSDYSWDEYPLTADKFVRWISELPEGEDVVNLFMNYEVLGNFQKKSSGIFDFMRALPEFAEKANIGFVTPYEAITKRKVADKLSVPDVTSWMDVAKDTSAWLGNSLQQEAFNKLYELGERVRSSNSKSLRQDWLYLQSSDNFYYMGTRRELPFSPFATPYEAFANYMNVLSDFSERVEAEFPSTIDTEELNSLVRTIHNQAAEINKLKKELHRQEVQLEDCLSSKEKLTKKVKSKASGLNKTK